MKAVSLLSRCSGILADRLCLHHCTSVCLEGVILVTAVAELASVSAVPISGEEQLWLLPCAQQPVELATALEKLPSSQQCLTKSKDSHKFRVQLLFHCHQSHSSSLSCKPAFRSSLPLVCCVYVDWRLQTPSTDAGELTVQCGIYKQGVFNRFPM